MFKTTWSLTVEGVSYEVGIVWYAAFLLQLFILGHELVVGNDVFLCDCRALVIRWSPVDSTEQEVSILKCADLKVTMAPLSFVRLFLVHEFSLSVSLFTSEFERLAL
jgi:hypothetical protein